MRTGRSPGEQPSDRRAEVTAEASADSEWQVADLSEYAPDGVNVDQRYPNIPTTEVLIRRAPTRTRIGDETALSEPGRTTTNFLLPTTPAVARDSQGYPVFSLTLVLSRQPRPNEETIRPLVERGAIHFDAVLSVPEQVVTDLSKWTDTEYRPQFVREATFQLFKTNGEDGESDPDGTSMIASAEASGTNPRSSLNANLDRATTLEVFDALEGGETDLTVATECTYSIDAQQEIKLTGSWAAIHRAIADRIRGDGSGTGSQSNPSEPRAESDGTVPDPTDRLSEGQLRKLLPDIIEEGVLTVRVDGTETVPTDDTMDSVFDMFLSQSSVVLRRVDSEYVLRDSPHDMFELNYTETRSVTTLQSRRISSRLNTLFDGLLDDYDRDIFIDIVALAPDDGGLTRIQNRVRRTESRDRSRQERSQEQSEPVRLSVGDDSAKALSVELDPRPSTPAGSRNPAITPGASLLTTGASGQLWGLDDIVLPIESVPRNLPIVSNPDAELWPDRLDDTQAWYAPELELVHPSSDTNPDRSPFLFTYEKTGVTGTGEFELEGTVTFELEPSPSRATQQAIQEDDRDVRPVPISDVNVTLEIPFKDTESGERRTRRLDADVSEAGDRYQATVRLRNEWVRIGYAVFAGIQAEPAEVVANYRFNAYEPVENTDTVIASGAKTASIPVVYSDTGPHRESSGTYFDASAASLHTPDRELRLDRSTTAIASRSRGPSLSMDQISGATSGPDPNRPFDESSGPGRAGRGREAAGTGGAGLSTNIQPVNDPVTIDPNPVITVDPDLGETEDDEPEYHRRTIISETTSTGMYPCQRFGALYRRRTAAGTESVGCRDDLQLGETNDRLYERLPSVLADDPELSAAVKAVYLSRSQLDRFLVVPRQYRIARYDTDSANPYDPAAHIYSLLDPDPSKSKLVFDATLQPALSPAIRRKLKSKLLSSSDDPQLVFPTAEMRKAVYNWAGSFDPRIVANDDELRVTLQTGLTKDGIVLLRRLGNPQGVIGTATFTLPDGSTLPEVELSLKLCHLTGPWDDGPIESESVTDRKIRLTNRITEPVAVSDLSFYDTLRRIGTVPVDETLDSGDTVTVTTPQLDADTDVFVKGEQQGCSNRDISALYSFIGESRDYTEDVTTKVFVLFPQMDYEGEGITDRRADMRFTDIQGSYSVQPTGDPPIAATEITHPVTDYLVESQPFQYRIVLTVDGTQVESEWLDWSLSKQGIMIDIAPELIRSTAAEQSSTRSSGPQQASSRPERDAGSSDRVRRRSESDDHSAETTPGSKPQ